jgi:phosphatidylinositol alpha-1,6-mannosyltransferase
VRVLVATEQRFYRAGGRVVTVGPPGYAFWSRYIGVFDEVGVLARVHRGPVDPGAFRDVTGPAVRVHEVPPYVGPSGYLRSLRSVLHAIDEATGEPSAVIVRAPSPLGALLLGRLRADCRRAFGLEVVGDPFDVFSRGSVRHPLRILFRHWLTAQLRRQCRQASAIAYVTRRRLQARYPPRGGPSPQFVTWCTSSDLHASVLAPRPRDSETFRSPFQLVTVASLEQPYKGVDVLIRAVDACRRQELDLSLTVVGDGRKRPALEALTQKLSLSRYVSFAGSVTPEEVLTHLDASHLFVLASRTEGLPQAMIEAMARGLPCVGSDVGGIPELLDEAYLVPVGSASALAGKLADVLSAPKTLAAASARNLATARQYSSDVVGPQREAFHEAVRKATLEEREGFRG